jgi:hypothetical protein
VTETETETGARIETERGTETKIGIETTKRKTGAESIRRSAEPPPPPPPLSLAHGPDSITKRILAKIGVEVDPPISGKDTGPDQGPVDRSAPSLPRLPLFQDLESSEHSRSITNSSP